MGILNLKKKGVYCGDFSRNNFHGFGIQISNNGKTISKCGNAKFYVGRWFRGKKEGRGKLYDEHGSLIYDGNFSDDFPTSSEFTVKNDSLKFSVMVIDDELFIGETINDIPNGYGIFQDNEGFLTFCPVQGGMKNGVGIMVLPPSYWGVFNIENELYFPIALSSEDKARANKYKINRQHERAELLQTFSTVLSEGFGMMNNVNNILSGNSSEIYANENLENKNNSSNINYNGSTVIGGQKYNIGEQQNYNSDKATYSKYVGMLSAAFAGNRQVSSSEIKTWQQKMKGIRKKWIDRGRKFPYSELEDR